MNEPQAAPSPRLRVVLPGVVSWSRPRRARGGVRYPPAYVRARAAWSLLVAQAVRTTRWQPPPRARYRVNVVTFGGGRRDLDRVCTAALDALQAGGALRDDCLVDGLIAERLPLRGAEHPTTVVEVTTRSAESSPRRRINRAPAGPSAADPTGA